VQTVTSESGNSSGRVVSPQNSRRFKEATMARVAVDALTRQLKRVAKRSIAAATAVVKIEHIREEEAMKQAAAAAKARMVAAAAESEVTALRAALETVTREAVASAEQASRREEEDAAALGCLKNQLTDFERQRQELIDQMRETSALLKGAESEIRSKELTEAKANETMAAREKELSEVSIILRQTLVQLRANQEQKYKDEDYQASLITLQQQQQQQFNVETVEETPSLVALATSIAVETASAFRAMESSRQMAAVAAADAIKAREEATTAQATALEQLRIHQLLIDQKNDELVAAADAADAAAKVAEVTRTEDLSVAAAAAAEAVAEAENMHRSDQRQWVTVAEKAKKANEEERRRQQWLVRSVSSQLRRLVAVASGLKKRADGAAYAAASADTAMTVTDVSAAVAKGKKQMMLSARKYTNAGVSSKIALAKVAAAGAAATAAAAAEAAAAESGDGSGPSSSSSAAGAAAADAASSFTAVAAAKLVEDECVSDQIDSEAVEEDDIREDDDDDADKIAIENESGNDLEGGFAELSDDDDDDDDDDWNGDKVPDDGCGGDGNEPSDNSHPQHQQPLSPTSSPLFGSTRKHVRMDRNRKGNSASDKILSHEGVSNAALMAQLRSAVNDVKRAAAAAVEAERHLERRRTRELKGQLKASQKETQKEQMLVGKLKSEVFSLKDALATAMATAAAKQEQMTMLQDHLASEHDEKITRVQLLEEQAILAGNEKDNQIMFLRAELETVAAAVAGEAARVKEAEMGVQIEALEAQIKEEHEMASVTNLQVEALVTAVTQQGSLEHELAVAAAAHDEALKDHGEKETEWAAAVVKLRTQWEGDLRSRDVAFAEVEQKLAATEAAAVEARADSKEAATASEKHATAATMAAAAYEDRVRRLREALSDVGMFASDTYHFCEAQSSAVEMAMRARQRRDREANTAVTDLLRSLKYKRSFVTNATTTTTTSDGTAATECCDAAVKSLRLLEDEIKSMRQRVAAAKKEKEKCEDQIKDEAAAVSMAEAVANKKKDKARQDFEHFRRDAAAEAEEGKEHGELHHRRVKMMVLDADVAAARFELDKAKTSRFVVSQHRQQLLRQQQAAVAAQSSIHVTAANAAAADQSSQVLLSSSPPPPLPPPPPPPSSFAATRELVETQRKQRDALNDRHEKEAVALERQLQEADETVGASARRLSALEAQRASLGKEEAVKAAETAEAATVAEAAFSDAVESAEAEVEAARRRGAAVAAAAETAMAAAAAATSSLGELLITAEVEAEGIRQAQQEEMAAERALGDNALQRLAATQKEYLGFCGKVQEKMQWLMQTISTMCSPNDMFANDHSNLPNSPSSAPAYFVGERVPSSNHVLLGIEYSKNTCLASSGGDQFDASNGHQQRGEQPQEIACSQVHHRPRQQIYEEQLSAAEAIKEELGSLLLQKTKQLDEAVAALKRYKRETAAANVEAKTAAAATTANVVCHRVNEEAAAAEREYIYGQLAVANAARVRSETRLQKVVANAAAYGKASPSATSTANVLMSVVDRVDGAGDIATIDAMRSIAEEQAAAVGVLTNQKAALEEQVQQQQQSLEQYRQQLQEALKQQRGQEQENHQSVNPKNPTTVSGGGSMASSPLSRASMTEELQYSRVLAEGRATELYELQMIVTALESEREIVMEERAAAVEAARAAKDKLVQATAVMDGLRKRVGELELLLEEQNVSKQNRHTKVQSKSRSSSDDNNHDAHDDDDNDGASGGASGGDVGREAANMGEMSRLRIVEKELTDALSAAEAAVEWHTQRAATIANEHVEELNAAVKAAMEDGRAEGWREFAAAESKTEAKVSMPTAVAAATPATATEIAGERTEAVVAAAEAKRTAVVERKARETAETEAGELRNCVATLKEKLHIATTIKAEFQSRLSDREVALAESESVVEELQKRCDSFARKAANLALTQEEQRQCCSAMAEELAAVRAVEANRAAEEGRIEAKRAAAEAAAREAGRKEVEEEAAAELERNGAAASRSAQAAAAAEALAESLREDLVRHQRQDRAWKERVFEERDAMYAANRDLSNRLASLQRSLDAATAELQGLRTALAVARQEVAVAKAAGRREAETTQETETRAVARAVRLANQQAATASQAAIEGREEAGEAKAMVVAAVAAAATGAAAEESQRSKKESVMVAELREALQEKQREVHRV
jgi:hypothetical protein